MLEYEVFKDIFDKKIFAKSKPDLLKKVAEYPDRYVGLFRPTKPEAKLRFFRNFHTNCIS